VFQAAADLFAARGFDGVGVDDIARAARANKAMIYYHFADKLALYRTVLGDMFRAVGVVVSEIADRPEPADRRMTAFIAGMLEMGRQRPWFPPLMLREMADGAPHLDAATLELMKVVFLSFGRILTDGQSAGLFRPVAPVLAYMSILAPMLLNAARERAGARPGRREFPMFTEVPHADLVAHMQQAALQLLSLEKRSA
jgi:TetR/AcrR family transcriptional regulator